MQLFSFVRGYATPDLNLTTNEGNLFDNFLEKLTSFGKKRHFKADFSWLLFDWV